VVEEDPPDRSVHPSPTTSDIETPQISPATAGYPIARLPGEPRQAAKEVFEAMGVSVRSGHAAAIGAFATLPEPIQRQQLQNDAQRDRMAFDLEQKQIDTDAKEREAQRAHDHAKWERSLVHHETNERRVFWFVVGALGVAVAGTVALFLAHQNEIAAHLVNTLIAGGIAYQGGKSAGFIKASKQTPALSDGHGPRNTEEK